MLCYFLCIQICSLLYIRLAVTLRWFTAGGAIRIALRQLSQTWKLRHYDVLDDVSTIRASSHLRVEKAA